ncbi:hypothetical protein ACFY15_12955 [Streptomyces sp. NPDC001373]|uniref:hypothetical protein n=1 Tax=Streptomyces sp. NPDC001373 TaxID=3364565 RepID=UPI0036870DD9
MSEPRPRVPMRALRAAMFAAVCVALAAVGHAHMSGSDIPPGPLLGAFAVTAALAWTAAGRRRGPLGIMTALLAVQAGLHLAFSAGQGHGHGSAPMAGHHPVPGMAMGAGPSGANPGGAAAGTAGAAHAAGSGALRSDPAGAIHAAGGTVHASGLADGARAARAAGLHDPAGAAHTAAMSDPATVADAAGTGMTHASGLADGLGSATGMADSGTGSMSAMPDGMGGVLADLLGTPGHGGLGMVAAHLLAGLFCAVWLAWGEAAVFRLAGALGATALLAARPLARVLALLRTRTAPVPGPPAQRPSYERPRRLRGAVHAHTAVRRGPPHRWSTRTTAPRPLPARAV